MPHRQLCGDGEKDSLEARNGLIQFDRVRELAGKSFSSGGFTLNLDVLLGLHECATRDIYSDAGELRGGSVSIGGTDHKPPPADEVPQYVAEMIAYTNERWAGASALHLCAYLMWRCNWIHPFSDGNGRTTRALSYLVFVARLGYEPGGTPTWVDMIADDKQPYYEALDAADAAWKEGELDVSMMEELIGGLLAKQLVAIVEDAGTSK